MIGFGSPDLGDLGFGSPDSGDLGFGSPSVGGFYLTGSEVPDDGGELVTVWTTGSWPKGCSVLIVGADRPSKVFLQTRKRIVFGSLPLPLGTYDLLITANGLVVASIENALTVVLRARCGSEDRLARLFPETWNVRDDGRIWSSSNRETYPIGGLRFLLRGFGQEIQRMTDRAQTRLRLDLTPTATTIPVESTYGFDSSGVVAVADQLWAYTSKDASNLIGAAPLFVYGVAVPSGSTVVEVDR